MEGKSSKPSVSTMATKRAPGDSFRGGYAAGKAKDGLRPPPASVTKAKATK